MPSIDQLLRALDATPGDAFLLYGIAMEHAKLGDHGAALGYFDKALAADATNPYHYFHKARSMEALGRIEEARAALAVGLDHARQSNDRQAVSEISEYSDQLG